MTYTVKSLTHAQQNHGREILHFHASQNGIFGICGWPIAINRSYLTVNEKKDVDRSCSTWPWLPFSVVRRLIWLCAVWN